MEFNLRSIIPDHIATLRPYTSARDDYKKNGDDLVFLDANEQPRALPDMPANINRYPGSQNFSLREKLAAIKRLEPGQVFLGNGSDEIIDMLMRSFTAAGEHSVVVFPPTFGMYAVRAAVNQLEVINVSLDTNFMINASATLKQTRPDTRLLFICHPNNPSGNTQPVGEIIKLLEQFSGLVVVDEAYIDFSPHNSMLPYLKTYPNLVVMQTFSKAYGLAGARVGVSYASADIQAVLNKVRFPYNLGTPSIELAEKALDSHGSYLLQLKKTVYLREELAMAIKSLPLVEKVYPSDANFLLVKTSDAPAVFKYLVNNGIIVRNRTSEPGCDGCLRISVGTAEENQRLITVWQSFTPFSKTAGTQTANDSVTRTQQKPHRTSAIRRKTSETDITLQLNLDGNGYANISTGLGFFDHMLHQIARHGMVDLEIIAKGDLETDPHHTIEDTGICLGMALLEAMGDKKGMERYGFSLPMDDSDATVLLDMGGRNYVKWEASFNAPHIGDIPTTLFSHFFRSLAESARCNIHISARGEDDHHKIEAIFKAFAKTLLMAVARNSSGATPSSKGIL